MHAPKKTFNRLGEIGSTDKAGKRMRVYFVMEETEIVTIANTLKDINTDLQEMESRNSRLEELVNKFEHLKEAEQHVS
jgi:hypothetical protein